MARVLHIEDDPTNRLLVSKVLGAAGHEVIDAESGLEGIRLAEGERPDLVLIDINIPDLDGYEVTLRLRGMGSMLGTPIVAISAEGDRETTLAVGADGFVQKPIDTRSFPELIAKFLSGYTERPADTALDVLRSRSQKIAERLETKVAELSAAKERLEQAADLRQMFLQNISHEFATPMTPVVGYLRLLLDEELGELTPLQRKCLVSINTSTTKLRGLIDTLIDVSHLERGQLHLYEREYQFEDVVSRAIEETQGVFKEVGVEIVREQSQDSMAARGDPDKLRRAMVHILDNAAKFTPRGSEVAVASRSLEDGRVLQFIVVDSGPGISEQDRQRIMMPFFQVDGSKTRTHGGVGLGLAFARHVAEGLGGAITVQSPPEVRVADRDFSGTAILLNVRSSPVRGESS